MVKISDLRMREVINVLDGKKLGNIVDIDLDMEKGKVLAFILPGRVRGWSIFSKREDIIIPWDKIVRIGKDVILVEAPAYSEIDQRHSKDYSGSHAKGFSKSFSKNFSKDYSRDFSADFSKAYGNNHLNNNFDDDDFMDEDEDF